MSYSTFDANIWGWKSNQRIPVRYTSRISFRLCSPEFPNLECNIYAVGIIMRNWIDFAQDRACWRALVNPVSNFRVTLVMGLELVIMSYSAFDAKIWGWKSDQRISVRYTPISNFRFFFILVIPINMKLYQHMLLEQHNSAVALLEV